MSPIRVEPGHHVAPYNQRQIEARESLGAHAPGAGFAWPPRTRGGWHTRRARCCHFPGGYRLVEMQLRAMPGGPLNTQAATARSGRTSPALGSYTFNLVDIWLQGRKALSDLARSQELIGRPS